MANYNLERDYPRWNRTWTEKLSDVDNQLVDFFRNVGDNTEDAFEGATRKISNWFDSLDLDRDTRSEWEKIRADQKLMRAQIENRVTHLVEDGKIKIARQMRGDQI